MEQRKGDVHYVTAATAAVLHGAPVEEDGFVGIAVKQIEAPAGTGLRNDAGTTPNPDIYTIKVGEAFVIRLKGLVYVTNARQEGGTFAVGDPVYINASSDGTDPNELSNTSAGSHLKFGRVEAIAGSRGVGTGKMRVNLDAKDTF